MKLTNKNFIIILLISTIGFLLILTNTLVEGTESSNNQAVKKENISTNKSSALNEKNKRQQISALKKHASYDQTKKDTYHQIIDYFPFANETFTLSLANNPQIYSNFYGKIQTVENPEDLLVLVNKNYALPENYSPEDLVVPNVYLATNKENNYLRKDAASALEAMFKSASEEGYILYARSGYRSYQTQKSLYNRYTEQNGQLKADTFSARPGHSEHQTGLAVDVTSQSVGLLLDDNFHLTSEGNWVKEHAHEFGFIIRYDEGKEHLTGFQYEPWHLRYVGKEVATEIKNNNWLLEEYLLMNGLFKKIKKDFN